MMFHKFNFVVPVKNLTYKFDKMEKKWVKSMHILYKADLHQLWVFILKLCWPLLTEMVYFFMILSRPVDRGLDSWCSALVESKEAHRSNLQ